MRKNLASLYFLQGINLLVPLLLLPYLTRKLGPESYGQIAFFQSIVTYGQLVLDYGFYVSAGRDASIARDDPQRLAASFQLITATKVVLLLPLAIAGIVAVLSFRVLRADWCLFCICSIQLVSVALSPAWLFQGVEKSYQLLAPQIASKVLVVLLVLVAVHSAADRNVAAFLISCSDLLVSILLLFTTRSLHHFKITIRLRDVRSILIRDFSLFVISVGSNLYGIFNPLLVELYGGPIEVAYYVISLRIANACFRLVQPAFQAFSPKIARLIYANGDAARYQLRQAFRKFSVSSICIGLALLLLSSQVINCFAGPAYLKAAPALRVYSVLPFLLSVTTLLGQNYCVHLGLSRAIAKIYWTCGIMNSVLLVWAVKRWGAVGAASSFVVCEAVIALLLYYLARSDASKPRAPLEKLD